MTEEQRQQLENIQKQIGDRGEDFVLTYERRRLYAHPRVNEVCIIGRKDVGMGYDILSFDGMASDIQDRYIEVKSYSGQPHFILSEGELAAANKYGTKYYLYLVDINQIDRPGYEPTVIQNPTANIGSRWQEKVKSREFVFVGDSPTLPQDIADSTVLIGCYNNNEHLQWILHNHAYNVRQGNINGSILTDEVSQRVRYLLLYAAPSPRTYRLYTIGESRTVNRSDMLRMHYPNPHAQRYLLYHITGKIDAPPLDIMQILRSYNDKQQRTSGTPIYMSGTQLTRYLLNGPVQQGTSNVRIYSNEGKPWSQVQIAQLVALYRTGTAIDGLAHKMKRSAKEIKEQLIRNGIKIDSRT